MLFLFLEFIFGVDLKKATAEEVETWGEERGWEINET